MNKKEYKAIALSSCLTARETDSGMVLLMIPQLIDDEGRRIGPAEVYLSRENVARLAQEFPVKENQPSREVCVLSEVTSALGLALRWIPKAIDWTGPDPDLEDWKEAEILGRTRLKELEG